MATHSALWVTTPRSRSTAKLKVINTPQPYSHQLKGHLRKCKAWRATLCLQKPRLFELRFADEGTHFWWLAMGSLWRSLGKIWVRRLDGGPRRRRGLNVLDSSHCCNDKCQQTQESRKKHVRATAQVSREWSGQQQRWIHTLLMKTCPV